jgi:hypothetical protein
MKQSPATVKELWAGQERACQRFSNYVGRDLTKTERDIVNRIFIDGVSHGIKLYYNGTRVAKEEPKGT